MSRARVEHVDASTSIMPRRDLYREPVVEALKAEGWTITDEPLQVSIGDTDLYVDLAAERVLGAVRGDSKIAVEIKSFLGTSKVDDLENAVGQYNVYRDVLGEVEPERAMYLAIPRRVDLGILSSPFGRLIVEKQSLKLLVFDENQESELEWKPKP